MSEDKLLSPTDFNNIRTRDFLYKSCVKWINTAIISGIAKREYCDLYKEDVEKFIKRGFTVEEVKKSENEISTYLIKW